MTSLILIRQFINETLNEVLPYTWVKDNKATFRSSEGILFEVMFKSQTLTHPIYGPATTGFDISFYKAADDNAPWKYKLTGEGKPFPILATVVVIVKDFLMNKKPRYVWFVADEPSRVRLYDRLVKKLNIPNYATEFTSEGIYTLRRIKGNTFV